MHMRATQHFHCGLLLGMTQRKEKKRNSEKHTEIFLEFLACLKKSKKKGKQKREKLFTRESSQQAKEDQGNLFGFSFLVL